MLIMYLNSFILKQRLQTYSKNSMCGVSLTGHSRLFYSSSINLNGLIYARSLGI